MKIKIYFTILLCILLSGCCYKKDDTVIRFAVSAEYPPFEYTVNNELVGFDIELARYIGQELGKKVEFQDMQFSTLLVALHNNMADAVISTMTVTQERKKNFDFSEPYYTESLALISHQKTPLTTPEQLAHKKIAAQLGSTMEIWLKENAPDASIVAIDYNTLGVESLKAGHVDGVLVDAVQAHEFTQQYPQLQSTVIAQADTGYAIVLNKKSPLKEHVNKALQSLQEKGVIDTLIEKYLKEQS